MKYDETNTEWLSFRNYLGFVFLFVATYSNAEFFNISNAVFFYISNAVFFIQKVGTIVMISNRKEIFKNTSRNLQKCCGSTNNPGARF